MELINKVIAFVFSVTVFSSTLLGGGLLWSDNDLAVWRDRAVNGPYKSAGDSFDSLIPGEWDRIVTNKNTFTADPTADRMNTYDILQDGEYRDGQSYMPNHIKMLDAAFYALVKEDATVAAAVKTEIMWHAEQAGGENVGWQVSPTQFMKTDNGSWPRAMWLVRMVSCADFIKDQFSGAELTALNAWFSDWANAYEYSINFTLSKDIFGNRTTRDYVNNVKSTSPGYRGYSYMDSSGTNRWQVGTPARYYNNRRASIMQWVGLAGAWLDDALLIDRSKLFFEEWIRCSVYPDGALGEFERNSTSSPNQGLLYLGSILESYVSVAEALRLTGDTSLYDYSTTGGLWQTECTTQPAKNVKLVVDTYYDLIFHNLAWYVDSSSVNEAYRIDATANGKESIEDIWFAPLGNRYWQDADLKLAYMRDASGSAAYTSPFFSSGPVAPWGGHESSYSSCLFMFADMENVGTGPVTPPVTPPVTDGLLSNTQWQNLSIELQAGQFSAEYDVVPNVSNMNGTTGLSFGNAATWDDLAVIIGFSEAGQLNARNGGVYSADAVVPYSAGTSYHFRIVGDIPAHTYSVYVTEGAGAEIQLANNYAFRSSQAAVSSLDTLAVTAVTGSHTVSNFTISASVALDTIAPSVPVGLSASAVSTTQINLTWTASSDAVGVAGYTIYREGTEIGSTDTSSYSDVGLSASSSYAYSLAAYDAAGNYSSQSAAVSATTAPEVDSDNLPDDWEIQYFGGINAVNGAEAEDFDGDGSSNYDEWLAGTDPSDATDFPVVTPPVTDGLLSNTQWQNLSIELQAGQFSAEYDVVPNVSNMNGTTGLSFGNAATWDDLAVIIGFSEAGQLNARNGGVYSADAVVPYSAGTSYHFRIVGDIPAHTYSVYVTEGAGAEIQLANNYAFRSSQAAVSSLDTLAVTAVTGSHTVSNFTISASVALDTIAPSVPVGLSASAVSTTQINLTWTASSDAVGVAGYTIYREGTEIGSTDTSSYSDVGLSASSSYAYSLAAYDAAGNYSSQSAAVSATTAPEVDSDNLPDDWEIQYFGGINAVNGAEAEDFDGDGSSNYDEWLAGTDPSDATDLLELRPVVGVAWTSVRDRSYEIDYSDNNWKTFITSETLLGGGGPMVWIDPSDGTLIHKRQYRVQVVAQ